MTFHANCLLKRQFAWNVISCFLGKIRKQIINLSYAENAQRVVKVKIWFLMFILNHPLSCSSYVKTRAYTVLVNGELYVMYQQNILYYGAGNGPYRPPPPHTHTHQPSHPSTPKLAIYWKCCGKEETLLLRSCSFVTCCEIFMFEQGPDFHFEISG